ncbi:transporter substrate-binding domain-containing protein [Cetobacterium sp. 8H]|uniref:HD domain-containing phosphohydrolase n=1 Tax=Cetobacterium sp. 8H TaxID=2759681 RepID=UPI00163D0066|nr:HD domain-containing phosphohydrolase [Cetobacterium sp. 8H]MBC2850995.1 transporter substrate-binding domain-containing protein [Cetobacterium sp. 8H]
MLKNFFIVFFSMVINIFSADLSTEENAWISKNRGRVIQIDSLRPTSIFLYRDEKGELRGVQKEFFKYLEKKIGVRFKFRDRDISLIKEDICNNNSEIVINASKNKSRDNFYKFVATPNTYYTGFYTKDFEILNLNDIHEKRVGIIEDSTEEIKFKESYNKQYENIKEIVYVKNPEDGFKRLDSGDIDVYLGKSNTDIFKSYDFQVLDRIAKNNLKIMVSKKEVCLANIVEKYQKKFFNDGMVQVLENERPIFYKQILKNDKDLKYIKENYKEIVVSMPNVEDINPLFYRKKENYFGYVPDRMIEFGKIVGVPIVFKPYKSGEYSNIKAVDYKLFKERSEYIIPYYESNVTFFSNVNSENLNLNTGLKDKKVGYISHEDLDLDFERTYEVKTIVRYNSYEEAFKAILDKEIEVLMGDFRTISLAISRKHLEKKIKIVGFYNEKPSVGFGVNIEDIHIARLLKKILPDHSSDFHILSSRLNIPDTPDVDYKYISLIVTVSMIIIFIMYFLLLKSQSEKSRAERITKALVESFEIANELNDEDTGNHILRVNLYSKLIAEKLGCSRKFIQEISTYASLHDVGKIGVSDMILKKPGKLTEEEFETMKSHVTLGHKLIVKMEVGEIAENIALYHHEKYDGQGYGMGLIGEDIPLEARIVSLADVYDALRQERVYKKGFSHEKAKEIIESERGKHFDPKIVDIFLKYNDQFDTIFKTN